jgi:hypothetical protein
MRYYEFVSISSSVRSPSVRHLQDAGYRVLKFSTPVDVAFPTCRDDVLVIHVQRISVFMVCQQPILFPCPVLSPGPPLDELAAVVTWMPSRANSLVELESVK